MTARAVLVLVALQACGGRESEGTTAPGGPGGTAGECPPPNRVVGDACREPGVQDDGCLAGTLGLGDGTCRPAGIPPEMCGEGFVHDGDVGCEPILPAQECPPGLMAVPGDAECHPVMPCARRKWGDIAVDAMTEHVDGSYAGGGSDGSAAQPWTTIGDAIAAAAPGATVAVAAGSYAEDVDIVGKPVVLWGVCPDEVEIVGTGVGLAAVFIREQASGTIVRGLGITGAATGIGVLGSEQVLVDGVWVHDNGGRGIDIESDSIATSCTVRRSLVEKNHRIGIFVGGSEATVEATVVRHTLANAQGDLGRGIVVQNGPIQAASALTVRGSLVEQNREIGVLVLGSEATIEATVVRGTLPDPRVLGAGIGIQENVEGGSVPSTATVRTSLVDQNHEVGVYVAGSEAIVQASVVRGTLPDAHGLEASGVLVLAGKTGTASTTTVQSSVVEQNHSAGVVISGSTATVQATVVRGTLPDAAGAFGAGITIEHDPTTFAPSACTVQGSLVEQNHEGGISVIGSQATVEATVVRTTQHGAEGAPGRGINIQDSAEAGAPTTALVSTSLIEQNHGLGVHVSGSAATIDATVVRGTLPDARGLAGRGINIQASYSSGARSNGVVRSSLVEHNREFGILALSSDVTIEGCLVRATLPNAESRFGDGISAAHDNAAAALSVYATRIEDSARAGTSSFGAFISLGKTILQCAPFDLEGESYGDAAFTFEDRGGNLCGCPSADGECLLATVGIEPPAPVTPID